MPEAVGVTGAPPRRRRGQRRVVTLVALLVVIAALTLSVRRPRPTGDTQPDGHGGLFRTTLLAEPGVRDPLHFEPVRVWSAPTLSGTWCRLPIGADVVVVRVASTPAIVFEITSASNDCRGWVAARHTAGTQATEP